LAQAEAGILAAQAQLALAEDALARVTVMREREAVPETQLVQTKGQRALAAAQLESARAQRDQARVLLRNHTLTAPFAGVIIRAPEGTGTPVGPGAPLFVIEDVSALVLETSLTQDEAAELPPKAVVSVQVPATGVRVDTATVRLIVPSVDPATNRVPIEIAVPNPDRRLLPHAFARATLPSRGERDAFRVRQAALTQQNGAFSLWMADAAGRATAVRVRVLAQNETDWAVVDPGPAGFPTGAQVIESPPLGITQGAQLAATAKPPSDAGP
jgi:RND family efflux transporter MFP subunit